jgi:hypothetical protein
VSILENIAAQRQKLLDGIDANDGDINLRIFEDFYPDEAHFIYELLQNAEDAGATEVAFELTAHGCFFEHNGTRHFNETDIRGITGIFNSSKKDNPDKIGKFGVGFKSVFVYTDTPVIYSRDYSFKILHLVLPQSIKPKTDLDGKTRFEFPFNNPKKNVRTAFSEVKSGLEQLSETTLLFLNNLRYISWKIGEQEGAVLREEHSNAHVEVLKLSGGKEVLSSHWLRFSAPVQNLDKFTAPVEGVERQKVALAFELAFVGDEKSFDSKKPIAKQFKIVPAKRGKVAVFFPAEKETSGLRFHLHAPFIPELSRASIKSSPENLPLFEQLATVAASSLHAIKALGLLTGEFLSTLPNSDDLLPKQYAVIREAILKEMRSKSLVPTYGGGFAPAERLFQARASLRLLLSPEDLAFVTGREDQPQWSISAPQKNSNQDRFLSSLGINTWDAENLKSFFEANAREADRIFDDSELDLKVLEWLTTKSDEWLQSLYALLYKHCEDEDYGDLRDVHFVKLESGEWGTGATACFRAGEFSADDRLNYVDEAILNAGTKKDQQNDAKRFLEEIGVREPNESDEIKLLLEARYSEHANPPSGHEYFTDLKRMMVFIENNPSHGRVFSDYRIFKVVSPICQWAKARDVYLDEPFVQTGLSHLYTRNSEAKPKRWPLDPFYLASGLDADVLFSFAVQLGCETQFDGLCVRSCCSQNPNWGYLSLAPGSRAGKVINRDRVLSKESEFLINSKKWESSLLLWNALNRSEQTTPSILEARYQLTDYGGSHVSKSHLVCQLTELAWVPQADGSFVKPCNASASKMPKGFIVDMGCKWMQAVGFGVEDQKREIDTAARAAQIKQMGFDTEEELQLAQAFTKLPKSEQVRLMASARNAEPESCELPERPLRNSDVRSTRVGEQARSTPEKNSVVKPRSVQVGVEAARQDAKLYLKDQYTNTNGQMICQACKGELPFKLFNGAYYFEAVEIIHDSPKRFREGFLALCPNHAAAYRHANAQSNSMVDLIAIASGNEIELLIGNIETTLYFTQTHLADAKACFDSIEEGEV